MSLAREAVTQRSEPPVSATAALPVAFESAAPTLPAQHIQALVAVFDLAREARASSTRVSGHLPGAHTLASSPTSDTTHAYTTSSPVLTACYAATRAGTVAVVATAEDRGAALVRVIDLRSGLLLGAVELPETVTALAHLADPRQMVRWQNMAKAKRVASLAPFLASDHVDALIAVGTNSGRVILVDVTQLVTARGAIVTLDELPHFELDSQMTDGNCAAGARFAASRAAVSALAVLPVAGVIAAGYCHGGYMLLSVFTGEAVIVSDDDSVADLLGADSLPPVSGFVAQQLDDDVKVVVWIARSSLALTPALAEAVPPMALPTRGVITRHFLEVTLGRGRHTVSSSGSGDELVMSRAGAADLPRAARLVAATLLARDVPGRAPGMMQADEESDLLTDKPSELGRVAFLWEEWRNERSSPLVAAGELVAVAHSLESEALTWLSTQGIELDAPVLAAALDVTATVHGARLVADLEPETELATLALALGYDVPAVSGTQWQTELEAWSFGFKLLTGQTLSAVQFESGKDRVLTELASSGPTALAHPTPCYTAAKVAGLLPVSQLDVRRENNEDYQRAHLLSLILESNLVGVICQYISAEETAYAGAEPSYVLGNPAAVLAWASSYFDAVSAALDALTVALYAEPASYPKKVLLSVLETAFTRLGGLFSVIGALQARVDDSLEAAESAALLAHKINSILQVSQHLELLIWFVKNDLLAPQACTSGKLRATLAARRDAAAPRALFVDRLVAELCLPRSAYPPSSTGDLLSQLFLDGSAAQVLDKRSLVLVFLLDLGVAAALVDRFAAAFMIPEGERDRLRGEWALDKAVAPSSSAEPVHDALAKLTLSHVRLRVPNEVLAAFLAADAPAAALTFMRRVSPPLESVTHMQTRIRVLALNGCLEEAFVAVRNFALMSLGYEASRLQILLHTLLQCASDRKCLANLIKLPLNKAEERVTFAWLLSSPVVLHADLVLMYLFQRGRLIEALQLFAWLGEREGISPEQAALRERLALNYAATLPEALSDLAALPKLPLGMTRADISAAREPLPAAQATVASPTSPTSPAFAAFASGASVSSRAFSAPPTTPRARKQPTVRHTAKAITFPTAEPEITGPVRAPVEPLATPPAKTAPAPAARLLSSAARASFMSPAMVRRLGSGAKPLSIISTPELAPPSGALSVTEVEAPAAETASPTFGTPLATRELGARETSPPAGARGSPASSLIGRDGGAPRLRRMALLSELASPASGGARVSPAIRRVPVRASPATPLPTVPRQFALATPPSIGPLVGRTRSDVASALASEPQRKKRKTVGFAASAASPHGSVLAGRIQTPGKRGGGVHARTAAPADSGGRQAMDEGESEGEANASEAHGSQDDNSSSGNVAVDDDDDDDREMARLVAMQSGPSPAVHRGRSAMDIAETGSAGNAASPSFAAFAAFKSDSPTSKPQLPSPMSSPSTPALRRSRRTRKPRTPLNVNSFAANASGDDGGDGDGDLALVEPDNALSPSPPKPAPRANRSTRVRKPSALTKGVRNERRRLNTFGRVCAKFDAFEAALEAERETNAARAVMVSGTDSEGASGYGLLGAEAGDDATSCESGGSGNLQVPRGALAAIKLAPLSPNTQNKVKQIVKENNRDIRALRKQKKRAMKEARRKARALRKVKSLEGDDELEAEVAPASEQQEAAAVATDAQAAVVAAEELNKAMRDAVAVADAHMTAAGVSQATEPVQGKRHRHPPRAQLAHRAPRRYRQRGLVARPEAGSAPVAPRSVRA
ncbi:uncharacterized protein AMSG_12231 [Thecamonas trahens ATCC 50062]|uniref:ELYS-like domain-containing protein n=1 Tax=Thecamonas trahens ATCC 50062 TaxID=461836 RepID=A0A0L0DKI0_THETB|nr:hypothetical protein AMSG_12231 [Thecamonas trahens ATCC 50062]KNC52894.1 hypothetical protein AMSG_12231 [Thecamonas trahens ATCC 50062]|eukprot:XP_013755017.1 hypothetical protein AMSG_12231 [Thecamonas trahens ATCC 50062]